MDHLIDYEHESAVYVSALGWGLSVESGDPPLALCRRTQTPCEKLTVMKQPSGIFHLSFIFLLCVEYCLYQG